MASSDGDGDGNDSPYPQYLPPSELGTKEYWETFYKRSLEYISSKRDRNLSPHPAPADAEQGQVRPGEDEDGDMDVDDDDDPGTSWFSEHKAPEKVLRFLTSKKFPLSPRNTIPSTRRQRGRQQQHEPSILDLGTGNGSMLALLRKKGGFKGPMVGVDYSPQSVQLARELQRLKLHSAYESGLESEEDDEEGYGEGEGGGEGLDEDVNVGYSSSSHTPDPDDEEHEDVVVADNVGSAEAVRVSDEIRFEEWDILAPGNEDALAGNQSQRIDWFPYETGGFDIVLDKGTFDAVSLSEDVIDDVANDVAADEKRGLKRVKRRVCERYPRIATKLVRKGGFLVVTSCNWTEDELIRWFTAKNPDGKGEVEEDDGLYVWDRIEYPRFRFGGQEGQGVCTVCFRRGKDVD
ncbi:hypothetical protein VTN77DRAFT_33 [Rasamsonia byssochlamydoides]|uniref:uncharacterized protein n=1 Tax=Rasamsonia byssochlamydoides TaxID=89139 RepID=UPI003741EC58